MQFTGNNNYGQPSNKKTIVLIIGGILILALLVVLIFQRTNKKIPEDTGQYYDPYSGETVSDPEGWHPENFANQENTPVFLGFSKLLDVGVTQMQLDAAKRGFSEYSGTRNNDIREVSLHINSIRREPFDRDSSDPTRRVSFTVTINRTENLEGKIEYTSIQNATLVLIKDGQEIFRSTEPEEVAD